MKRKEAVYKGLQFVPVWYSDTSLTSPDYFQITEFPTRLTAGKNLFKLRGHPTNLRPGSYLNIEVLDYNGDPIYSEIINFIDEDKSRVIAIYIYSETSPGDCTITITGEAVTAPTEWQGRANVKWTRSVPVNPNVSNISEIIFETTPELVIAENVGVHLDRVYSASGQFPTYSTGTVRYFLYNNQPAIELTGGSFTNDMSTGTLTVAAPSNPTPTPNFPISTTSYTSTIKKILTNTVALLDVEYTAYSSQSISAHTYTAFDASAYSIAYEATPTYVATQNSESFALAEIKGLDPATGDVSRVKVFMNNNGTVGTWELLNDVELAETEIFVTSTASLYPDVSIGSFVTQSTIDTYWQGVTYQGNATSTAPVLTWTTASLNNSMQIQNSVNISATNTVSIAKIQSSYAGTFIANSEYKVTLDALGSVSGSNSAKLSLYMSGSAFNFGATDYFNQELPVKLGKRIGELQIAQTSQRWDDQVFSFTADNNGTGVLLLVVEEGLWQVADVHTTTDNDSGYSPNYTRLRTLVPTAHKSRNQLTFKAEYYNVNGERSKQISYVYNKDWEGGNRYVDGDYSMLTGSLYVADTLSAGVAISGYKNTGFIRSLGYEGFTAGFPGFLIWSGSALSGSAGTIGGIPYSGVGLELYANTASYFRYSTTDNSIEVRTDKFFFGNNNTFISGANGNIEISASNFHLSQQGNVTASNALFTGVALANIIRDKTVTITTANSASYLVTTGTNSSFPIGTGYAVILNGNAGGEIIRRIRIDCDLAYPIFSFTLPSVDASSRVDVVVEFARTNQIYDVFSVGKSSFPIVEPAKIQMTSGSVISLLPAGSSGTRLLVQYGTEMPMDYTFKQDVIVSGSLIAKTVAYISSSAYVGVSTGPSENTLTLGPPLAGGTGEGGQIGFTATGGTYTSASFIDNYQNQFRILKGTNAGSVSGIMVTDLQTNGTQFLGAVTASAYNGLPNDYLYVTRATSNQTIGSGTWANRDIIFNNTIVSKGISYNTSTGLASLTGGKIYRITARLAWSAAAAYLLEFSCYDSSNTQLGPTTQIVQSTNASNNISDGTLDFIYAPSSNVDIKIRTTNNTSALTGESIRYDLNTQLIIQQIA